MSKNTELYNISIDQIDFGTRHREEYGDLESLAADIRELGLIHPINIVDKRKIEGSEEMSTNDKPYLLAAGGRRLSAFIEHDLGGAIPAYVHPRKLSYYELRKIELMENISRKELTWQEKSDMTGEIHELEQKLKGKSHTSSEGGHSLQDTADMLNKSKSTVKNEVDLAKALKELPELRNIKNKTEALKVMRQMQKSHVAETRADKARKELKTKGQHGVKQDLMNQYVCGDFFEHAEKLKAGTFDLIEIDPPYGIDLGNVKKKSKHTTLNYNEVAAAEYEAFMNRTLLYAKKLLKKGGWLVCWYAIDPWHDMVSKQLDKQGFKGNSLPCLWVKNGGQTNRPQHYFGSCYEPFFYRHFGNSARLNKGGSSNYMVHAKVPPEQKVHPTQRPVSLMEELISRFINDGKILVPFAGSGVTIRAAHNLGLKAIGYDLSQDAKNKHDALIADHDLSEPFTL